MQYITCISSFFSDDFPLIFFFHNRALLNKFSDKIIILVSIGIEGFTFR